MKNNNMQDNLDWFDRQPVGIQLLIIFGIIIFALWIDSW
jgi:hypothetical protein